MPVSSRYVLHQGPMLSTLVRTALSSARPSAPSQGAPPVELPGPELHEVVAAPPADLVRDYVKHVGGDPNAYKGRIPGHLFSQWSFPVMARVLGTLNYPMTKVVNGGCRLVENADLPLGEPLHVRVRLESIDDDGRRALLRTRILTGTAKNPEIIVAYQTAFVPLGSKGASEGKTNGGKPKGGKPKSVSRVPEDARELGFWKIPANAGVDFAKLTGDFNPIHLFPAYARAMGFRSTILHGFSTMARAMEGMARSLFSGSPRAIASFDAKFTRPLVLPARVGLYGDRKGEGRVYVGDAPGGGAYLEATYTVAAGFGDSRR